MATKKKKRQEDSRVRTSRSSWQPSYWMIVALIAIFFAGGVIIIGFLSPGLQLGTGVSNGQPVASANADIVGQVQLVAANFRCACGGCGELFLIDCTCDMPRGATEEKDFIRRKLQQGLSLDEVITLVDKEYGHRIS